MSGVDVLVVAPHSPELEGLVPLLGKGLSNNVRGLSVSAKPVGIGLPGVSGGTVARLDAKRPRAVVMIGTCAAYPGRNLSIGQLVVPGRIVLADAAVLHGQASFPDPMTGLIEPNRVLTSALTSTGSRGVSVASTLSVTTDPGLASKFATHLDCDVEHQESFGVALACAPGQIPFAGVLGISHEVGPNAFETWRVNHRSAAYAAASLVASWLQAGAAGLVHGR